MLVFQLFLLTLRRFCCFLCFLAYFLLFVDKLKKSTTCAEFDGELTLKLNPKYENKYENLLDELSPISVINHIKTPTCLINSRDDVIGR